MDNGKTRRIELCFNAGDSTYIVCEFLRAQALAWNGHIPFDAELHEKTRPQWVPLLRSIRNDE